MLPFFHLQVLARKGGPQPKKEAVKGGHVAATVSGPAKGKMYPTLWTYSGKENPKNMLAGTKNAYAQKTEKGWPDETSWRAWAQIYLKERAKRKIFKGLVCCDNADLHMDPEVAARFAKERTVLLGFIKGGTANQQPLDVDFFGRAKPLAIKIAAEEGLQPTEENLAYLFERAVNKLEQRATQKGTSPLADGFKKAGIFPFNPAPFTDEQMAGSVLATGLTKDHEAVKKAKKVAQGWGKFAAADVKKAIEMADPKTSEAYKKGAALAAARHQSLEDDAEMIDPRTGAARYIYTSDSFVAAQNAKEKAKAAEEARVAKAAAERKDKAAQNKAAEEARKKAAQVRRVESEKRKAVEAAAKASRKELKLKKAAEKAARAKAAPVVQAAKKGKRAREDEEDNHKKQKPKK